MGAFGDNTDLKALIRNIPDFPEPGIQCRDVTGLLLDGPGFAATTDRLAARAAPMKPDLVAAVEARGFLFGAAVAKALGIGILPIRKPGSSPATRSASITRSNTAPTGWRCTRMIWCPRPAFSSAQYRASPCRRVNPKPGP